MSTTARTYFSALDTSGKRNLYVTDGTPAGTRMIAVPTTSLNGLQPAGFAVVGGTVFFSGWETTGRISLYKLDSATNAVSVVPVTNAAASFGLNPSGLVAYAGKVYFQGKDILGRPELFSSDGTAAGTAVVPLGTGGSGGIYVSNLTVFNGKLVFAGEENAQGALYISDGTAAGTVKLAVPGGSTFSLQSHSIASLGKVFVFEGTNSGNKLGLFVSDGTSAGTRQLSLPGVNPTGGYTGYPTGLLSFGTRAAFTASDASGKTGVWITDGTEAGTTELPGLTATAYGTPMAALAGGRVAFIGQDAAGKSGVYVSNGTAAGTTLLSPAGAAASGLAPGALLTLGSRIVFDGALPTGGRGLFVSDGTTTTLLASNTSLISGYIDTDGGLVQDPFVFTAAGVAPTVRTGDSVVIGTVALGQPGEALAVDLASDEAFPTGSSVSIDAAGVVRYTPGVITAAQAGLSSPGLDRVLYRVIDPATGQTVNATASVLLARTAPPPFTLAAAAPAPTLRSGETAVIGTVTPGEPGETLSVSLLSDATFPTGSAVSVDAAGAVRYTAGVVGTAQAGADVIRYRVTDPNTGQAIDGSETVTLKAPPGPALGFANASTGQSGVMEMQAADAGGPGYLTHQYIYSGSDNIAFSTQAPNVFVHSGAGSDSIQVGSGQNVLDGGLGSNFLTGGTGTDTFFTDARNPGVVWNTLRNFHAGDAATLWGFTSGVSSFRWETALAGAQGYEGATLRANIVGGAGRTGDGIDASITFTGLSVAQASKLQIVTGTQPAGSYLFIYNPGV